MDMQSTPIPDAGTTLSRSIWEATTSRLKPRWQVTPPRAKRSVSPGIGARPNSKHKRGHGPSEPKQANGKQLKRGNAENEENKSGTQKKNSGTL
jgi:hypothetical protein